MTLINDKQEMTVREAIVLCVENEINGAERQLASFDKNGRLSNRSQIDTLKNNLECMFNEVEVTGGGKRGKVFVSNPKSEVTEKVDGRVHNTGQPTAEEQIIMNQYIFNKLKERSIANGHMEYSVTGWSREIGLLESKDIPTKKLERAIRSIHADTIFPNIKPEEVVRIFKTDTIYNRNKQVITSALNRLHSDGVITVEKHYNMVDTEGNRIRIQKEMYDHIRRTRKIFLENNNSSVSAYNYAVSNPTPSRKQEILLDKVGKELDRQFDCDFVYESLEVSSVSEQECYDTNAEEFMQAYWKRLVTLTESRQRSYDNKPQEEQTWFWRKFYAMNTLAMMECLGEDVEEELSERKEEVEERTGELNVSFAKWSNQDVDVMVNFEILKRREIANLFQKDSD